MIPARLWTALWIGISAGAFLWRAVPVLAEPLLLNYGEGISLLAGVRALRGDVLYPPVQDPPFFYLAYPPLYTWLCAWKWKFAKTSSRTHAEKTAAIRSPLSRRMRRNSRPASSTSHSRLSARSPAMCGPVRATMPGLARLDALYALLALAAVDRTLAFLRSSRPSSTTQRAGWPARA